MENPNTIQNGLLTLNQTNSGQPMWLQIRAEGKQTTVTILEYKLSEVPWHVGESTKEFDTFRFILGVKRVIGER